MAYQSLYRRYRPQKFAEIKGQDHVVRALQTAVREDKVGHAYLLHGPRGTGKTTTARVLAKALNCEALGSDGEPCCACESCLSIEHGRSFDLHELDAASNNKVDDMRTLLERVNLATPGRAKVYLLDEVHMLTSGAENALLKTLEEPPGHVTWVLATTEPHKVVQTIRSRCQVFELGLIDADTMAEHIRGVVDDAELGVDEAVVDHVVAAGGGSARDALTALDRVVAGGGTVELDSSTDSILGALADHDRAKALSAVGDAVGRGRDPRTIGEAVLAGLRDAFLVAMGDPPARMSEQERSRAEDLAGRMAPAAITRALETLGRALIDMRQAPDPRVDVEVALVKLCDPESDRALDALIQRIDRLEERLGAAPGAPAVAAAAAPRPASPPTAPAAASTAPASGGRGRAPAGRGRPPADRGTSRSRGAGRAQSAREQLGPRRNPPKTAAAGPAAADAPPGPGLGAPPPQIPAPDPASMRPRTPTELVSLAGRYLGLDRDFVVARAMALEPDRELRRHPDQLLALWRDLREHSARTEPESAATRTEPAVPADYVPAPAKTLPSSPTEAHPGAAHVQPTADASPEPQSESGWQGRETPSDPVIDWSAIPIETSGLAESARPGSDPTSTQEPVSEEDEVEDVDDLIEAPSHAADIEDKIRQEFPGAELKTVPDPDDTDTDA